MQAVQKDLMDMLVRELKEGGAGGARSAQDRQQGVAAPEAARRDRARGAHLLQSETESHRECTYLMHTFTGL